MDKYFVYYEHENLVEQLSQVIYAESDTAAMEKASEYLGMMSADFTRAEVWHARPMYIVGALKRIDL